MVYVFWQKEYLPRLRKFYDALDAGDMDLAFILINELSEMADENDRELEKASKAYKEVRIEVYKTSVKTWETHLDKSNYLTVSNEWKLFVENESYYTSVEELDEWSKEMNDRKEEYLTALAQEEYIKANSDLYPFRERLKFSFQAQNLFFKAFQVKKRESYIREIDRCIDL